MTIPEGLHATYLAQAKAERREQVSPAVAALRTALWRSIHTDRRAA